MRFIVRRYDSVPTVDQTSGDAVAGDVTSDSGCATDVTSSKQNVTEPNGFVGQPDGEKTAEAETTFRKLDQDLRAVGLSLDTLTDGEESTAGGALAHAAQIGSVVARGRAFAKRHRRRLVCKNGTINIVKSNMSEQRRRFFADIFTTLLDLPWRYIIAIFTLGFVMSWLGFAVLWFVIMKTHGDDQHIGDETWTMCIANVHDFTTALLFSIETQHTIGYGARMVESACIINVPFLMAQSVLGVFIQSLLTGLIFAKLSRPKKRSNTLMFSRNAVICKRDGQLYLIFRLGDMRKSHIIGATIRAVMMKNRFGVPLFSFTCFNPMHVLVYTYMYVCILGMFGVSVFKHTIQL